MEDELSLSLPLPANDNLSADLETDNGSNSAELHVNDAPGSLFYPLIRAPQSGDDHSSSYSHVSLLGAKYLLFGCSSEVTSGELNKCMNVETREQFSFKAIPRNDVKGLSLLAAYHRLDEFSSCICAIHEILLSPKSLYLIFPTHFGSVHSYILAKGRLNESEASNIFQQIVSAVHYCHGKGIVLGDLKMGRFVFTDKEKTILKLETLENAAILDNFSDDRLSDKHGCPNYVSPEKADILRSDRKYPGRAADVWGLGVILYTMLVGRYPFNDADHLKLFVKIRKGHFTMPDYLSHSVKCLLRSLLRKDPTGRLTCHEVMQHPWVRNMSPGSQPHEGGIRRCNLLESCIQNIDGICSLNINEHFSRLQSMKLAETNETNEQMVPDIDKLT